MCILVHNWILCSYFSSSVNFVLSCICQIIWNKGYFSHFRTLISNPDWWPHDNFSLTMTGKMKMTRMKRRVLPREIMKRILRIQISHRSLISACPPSRPTRVLLLPLTTRPLWTPVLNGWRGMWWSSTGVVRVGTKPTAISLISTVIGQFPAFLLLVDPSLICKLNYDWSICNLGYDWSVWSLCHDWSVCNLKPWLVGPTHFWERFIFAIFVNQDNRKNVSPQIYFLYIYIYWHYKKKKYVATKLSMTV